MGSCAIIIVRRRDGASVGQIIWPYGIEKTVEVESEVLDQLVKVLRRELAFAHGDDGWTEPEPSLEQWAALIEVFGDDLALHY